MMKIDVNKSGRIFDFLVSSGMLRLSYDPNAVVVLPPPTNGASGVSPAGGGVGKAQLTSSQQHQLEFQSFVRANGNGNVNSNSHGKENFEVRKAGSLNGTANGGGHVNGSGIGHSNGSVTDILVGNGTGNGP